MPTDRSKCAEAGMMIRKPAPDVFAAIIDPEITKKFWFTKGSGKLELNKAVTWEWEMYQVTAIVVAKEIRENELIRFEWNEPARTVEFRFRSLEDGSTYVSASECGFNMTGKELLQAVKDSTGGFTTVLDGLKAFLEHGIQLNLVADKFPKEILAHGR